MDLIRSGYNESFNTVSRKCHNNYTGEAVESFQMENRTFSTKSIAVINN